MALTQDQVLAAAGIYANLAAIEQAIAALNSPGPYEVSLSTPTVPRVWGTYPSFPAETMAVMLADLAAAQAALQAQLAAMGL